MYKNICIFYANAGGGHLSVAKALKEFLESNRPWKVTLVDAYAEFDYIDLFKIIFRKSHVQLYNESIGKDLSLLVRLFSFFILKLNLSIVKHTIINKVSAFLEQTQPDLVISVMPWVDTFIDESISLNSKKISFVTIPTDFDEFTNKMWFSSERQFLICGTDKLIEQAKGKKHPQHALFAVPGMIVAKHFYDTRKINKKIMRENLQLDPNIPTGLVLYGKNASKKMLAIAEHLSITKTPLQFIFVCGNAELAKTIENIPSPYLKKVFAYTDKIYDLMQASDFFIGKPGSISVSEALVMRLPVILEYNNYTFFQEQYIAKWVKEKKVGLLFEKITDIKNNIDLILNTYHHFTNAFDKLGDLDALFHIPAILDSIFASQQSSQKECTAESSSEIIL